ncbi:MAG: hypothetical protein Q8R02_10535 [Hyphomonadaceae bacterium]|nr:hypothetical protein [Hyphomonadaceae bacterium]
MDIRLGRVTALLAAGAMGLAACVNGPASTPAAFDAAALQTAANAVLRDGYPVAEVTFAGDVVGYPAITYSQPAGFRPNTLDVYVPAAGKRPVVTPWVMPSSL